MHEPIIENPLKKGRRVHSNKSRCLAQVIQSLDRICQLRDMDMPWIDIASHLRMSTASLRKCIQQINEIKADNGFDKPNALCPQLTIYFKSEAKKKEFMDCAREIQKNKKGLNNEQ